MKKMLADKRTKRWFSLFAAFILVVSLFPIMSNAYGEDGFMTTNKPTVLHEEETIPEKVAAAQEAKDAADETAAADKSNESVEADPDGASGLDDEALSEEALAAAAVAAAADPTWVSAGKGAKVDFDKNDTNKATVTGGSEASPGTITVALEANKSKNYTLTINGYVQGVISVPANTTLNLKGTGTLKGTGGRRHSCATRYSQ